ncbi:hypothetical protein N9N28_06885 [Rubripirellula amarantea]|uniref:Uncharacterized protein n=1 Tax=Rubripirellula amarantea TaxID=2527999 RepID=A0A5C5WUX1_9BACT|nr:hypothetical protein [Rubripirellula amarantea]MDA8744337.1 hypothetical protein [Rubripirellula amarantea]TWT53803.1 hypothetical protein Pla22_14360 [Rubripirellula amarantea]
MNHRTIVAGVALILIALATLFAWFMYPIDHSASGTHATTFSVDCDYDKFRQIMVRKNATAKLVAQSGMTLVDEQIEAMDLDTSNDNRPLLNAIRGKSRTDVTAVKEITVQLDDPAIDADRLVLSQHADVQADLMDVITKSKAAAGNLRNYETTLQARPNGGQTDVSISVSLQVDVRVPQMFTAKADREVQQSAVDAVVGQAEALKSFVAQYSDKKLILPEL